MEHWVNRKRKPIKSSAGIKYFNRAVSSKARLKRTGFSVGTEHWCARRADRRTQDCRPCPADRFDPGLAPVRARIGWAFVKQKVRDMSVKLSDKELELMSAAARLENRILEPPNGVGERGLTKISEKLVGAGLAREIKAKTGAPIWRRDKNTEKSFTLKLTAAGQKAIAADVDVRLRDEGAAVQGTSDVPSNSAELADTNDPLVETSAATSLTETATPPGASVSTAAIVPREGTKIANVLGLLQRNEGATLDEVIEATGWLPHTSRAALTGLRKRGYGIERRTRPEGGRAYAIHVAR